MAISNKLTDLKIRQAIPSNKVSKLSDGRGMYLLLHPNGSKYWRMDFRHQGKQKTLALGIWPEVSLREARERRDKAKFEIQRGINPIEQRRTEENDKKSQQKLIEKRLKNTFHAVANEWLSKHALSWSEDHIRRVTRALENHIYPYLRDQALEEIEAPELLDVLRKLESQGKHEAAHRARQRLEAIFRYGITTRKCKKNPAIDLKGALTTHKVKNHAYLQETDIPIFMSKLDQYDGDRLTKLAVKFILYTFVRTSELRFAVWDEIDLDEINPIWKIPSERMKMKRPHYVPLVPQTIQLLDEVRTLKNSKDLIFPSQKNIRKAMSENTLLYALYRMGYHSRTTVHGFRSTASTVLNESRKWHPDVIERQLAHVEGNKVRAAYNHAEYLDERREMMQWWADKLDEFKECST